MLTPKQAFKAGFLKRCLDLGVDPAEAAEAYLEKRALGENPVSGLVGKALDVGASGLRMLGNWSLPVLALPPVAAYMAGHALGKARSPDALDLKSLREVELMDELRRQTTAAKRRTANAAYNAGGTV